MEKIVQQPATSSAQKHFSQLPAADTERSTFDRSHGYKTTIDAGYLYPIYVDEVVPGDTFKMNTTIFARLATPLKPIMDNMQCDIHYFFVPNRLVWDNWHNFLGERVNPDDNPDDYSIPKQTIALNSIAGTVADYFGLPQTTGNTVVSVTDLPFRGYKLIYNDWYRDQNLEDSIPIDKGDTSAGNYTPYRRNKRKDYFTSSLPWPQKGDPVYLPLGSQAPVGPNSSLPKLSGTQNVMTFKTNTGAAPANGMLGIATQGLNRGDGTLGSSPAALYPDNLWADLTEATAATINDIRTAFQIQKLLERDARGGTRAIEIILNHFNVQVPDMRLQRPEYLGGGTGSISINPVASTAPLEAAPQANLAATGTGVIKGGFNHSFVEHGYVFGIMSVRADLTYQNGVERFWTRSTRYDFYWPSLAHLGEQAVKNIEIYANGDTTDDETWGFQERYAEYRYRPGRITGKFRSNDPETLDVWHLAQDFDDLPNLNKAFIQEDPPVDRIIAVQDEPHFLVDAWHSLHCTRPMPVYSVPGLVDHF